MKEKIDLILLCISGIAGAIATLLIIFALCTCACFSAETKQIKKTVSQSTSQENKIRKQMYNQCVQSGENRARCYYLFY